jgi:ketosteroid isomerase-like protein
MSEDTSSGEVEVVTSFNEAINDRDLDRLASMMTDAHRFVDSAGATIVGKLACIDAWRGFFAAFPDYRNLFEEYRCEGDGMVFVRGHSECSDALLQGPAEWRVIVRNGLVDQWQVFDPST